MHFDFSDWQGLHACPTRVLECGVAYFSLGIGFLDASLLGRGVARGGLFASVLSSIRFLEGPGARY